MKKLILLLLFIPLVSFSQQNKFSANNIQEFKSWMNYAELENKAVIIDFVVLAKLWISNFGTVRSLNY